MVGRNPCCGQLAPPIPVERITGLGVYLHHNDIHSHGFDYHHFVVTLGFVVVIVTSMICLFSFPDSDDEDEDAEADVAGDGDCEEFIDGMAPTSKRKKVARRDALNKCLGTGEYPEFTGLTGVVDELDHSSTECLDFVKLLWPDYLCEHIAVQTNLYARQSNASGWVNL